ncbi:helix-turn-helix domain-containing protein [Corynebacterium cystitidis]|uniref:helix-turn-helix domain-containing protein n=1 Tax=Corynebacterium cystitidis TaxID=35757 RepID=UPI00211F42D7|nr:helix-turn-helix domain-containing protein [Corynebacterium cystitidis]
MAINQRDRQYAETHQLFIDVAFKLFCEKGYSSTSMNQIAVQAGFSRTALYLHFPNKPAIVLEHMRLMDDDLRHVVLSLSSDVGYTREHPQQPLRAEVTLRVEVTMQLSACRGMERR